MAAKKTEAKDHSMDKDDDDDDDDDDEDMVVRQTCIWCFNQFFTCIFHKCLFTEFISFLIDSIHHGYCA